MPGTATKHIKSLWLIEDDRIYRDVMHAGLKASLGGVAIKSFSTESQALESMEKVEAGEAPPDLVIADVMVPHNFPGVGEIPEDIAKLGDDASRTAGVRLWKKARNSKAVALQKVPWIYHSVLRRRSMNYEENSDSYTRYVGKDQDFQVMMDAISEDFDIDSSWDEADEIESTRLQQSVLMKQRLLAAMQVPLENCLTVLE